VVVLERESMSIDIMSLAGVVVALLAVIVTVAVALMHQIDGRFVKAEVALDSIDQKAENIRTEVYQEFVRRGDHEALREDIRKLFSRLETISASLHELIGCVKHEQGDRGKHGR
jgi:tetrahydromethanopterin S-methyltransferase subunit G